MYLGERYQVDTTERSILRIPEGSQPAKPLFPGAIGVGPTAVVYRGIDTHTGKAVAIKVLQDATDVKSVTRFQRQAKITMKLQHPNIVQVYDFGQFDGSYFTVYDDVITQRLYKMPPPPGKPEPPAQFYGSIPQALENIIMRCLETSPDKRYQNGSELAHALQELAS